MKRLINCLALIVGLMLHVAALAQSANFVSMVPVRLLDTRPGGSTIDGQGLGGGPIPSLTTVTLNVWGRGGIPTGAGAVALNVTAMNPTAAGYFTVWPTGVTQPTASSLNFVAGQTISNQVIAKVSATGQVSIYVYAGYPTDNVQVVVDVAGYFPAASNLVPLTPARILDTRSGTMTVDGQFQGIGAIHTASMLDLTVNGRGGVPTTGVSAVVLNVTVTDPTLAGYITAWPSGSAQPNASNVNFLAGQTLANLVIVAPGPNGNVSLYNGPGRTSVVADVVGYFSSTTTLTPVVPARLMDTRSGMNTVDGQNAGEGAFSSPVTRNLTVTGRGGVPTSGVGAVALNLTVVTPTTTGHLTAWGTGTTAGYAPPGVLSVNYSAGSIISGLVISQVGPNGQVSIFSDAGNPDVIADVVGWFPSTSNPPPPSPTITAGISTGGDGYTVHLKGTNFQANSTVDVRAGCGGNIIQSYSGSSVHVVDSSNLYLTITDPSQQSLFASNGEYFYVVNPTPTATWSTCQFVQWASPPSPQLLSGNTTGADSYTIHLSGQYFHSDSYVDVRTYNGGPVIASYSGSQLSITNDSDISFYISDPTQRSYLNSSGLYFWVVNPTPSVTWNGPVALTRIEPNVSTYDSLANDQPVSGTQTVLQRTFTLTAPAWVLFSTDGNVRPSTNSGITYTSSITLDAVTVSNPSALSWIGTSSYDTHSFNNIAAKYVQPGTHVVQLVATTTGGGVSIGASTNLSVMVSPATTVLDSVSGSDVGPINFNTYSSAVGNNDRSPNPDPHQYLPVTSTTVPVSSNQPLVLLASGTHYQAGHDGDSAIGFWLDGAQSTSVNSTWSFNDLCSCAELKAPFFLHGLYPSLSSGNHQATLGGAEFYWSDQRADNPVIYKISAASHLIALSGNIQTSGVLYSPVGFPNATTSMLNSIPVTPTAPQTMASGTINVPSTSSGVVYMTAKARLTGDGGASEVVSLRIMVDGNYVGSVGMQTCSFQNSSGCVSGRTLTASYLATGANKLSVGTHTVQVIGSVQSPDSSRKLYLTDDAPFIWFD